MGDAIRAFDWCATPLGPLDSWPDLLRTILRLCLSSRLPMVVWWGPGLTHLYNDAYIPLMGKHHPGGLGMPAATLWSEIWPSVGPQIEAVLATGEASWSERVLLVTHRNGYEEPAYFNYSHSPVFSREGSVAGIFCVIVEQTSVVEAERRQSLLFEISDIVRRTTSQPEILLQTVNAIGRHFRAAYVHFELVNADGKTKGIAARYGLPAEHSEALPNPAQGKVPILIDGILRADLHVTRKGKMLLTPDDIDLIEEAGRRVWDSLERVRAEESIRRSERRQALLIELMRWQREMPDADAVPRAAVEALGGALQLQQASFFEVRENDSLWFTAGWTSGRMPLLIGGLPVLRLGDGVWDRLRVGQTIHVQEGTIVYLAVPIMREGICQAGLCLGRESDLAWTEEDVAFARDIAERTWDGVERARAETARKRSEDALLFAVEAAGGVSTWRYDPITSLVAVNDKMKQLFSVVPSNSNLGIPLRAFLASIHEEDRSMVVEHLDRAIESSGDYEAEYRVIQTDGSFRWLYARGKCELNVDWQPVQMTGVLFDITDRKEAERRDAFLVQMDDRLRPLSDPIEITKTAARLLGEHLDVNRCAYADVEPDGDQFNLTGDYSRGVPSIVGRYRFSQFGVECLRLMLAGKEFVVEDSELDLRTEAFRPAYRMTEIRSVICVPLMKQDRFVAAMAVHQITPRRWREAEVELVLHVAGRCWESIERAKVARELRDREERFRSLADSIPQMVWTAGPDGQLTYVSRQASRYFNAPAEEIVGAGWLGWVHPDQREQTIGLWSRSLATGQPYETAFRLLRGADAMWRWHLVRAVALRDEDGNFAQWVGTCTDIETQKQTEELLQQQWRTFDTALSHTPDYIYILDLEGRFVYANRVSLELFQLPLEELRGKTLFDLNYPSKLATRLHSEVLEVIATMKPIRDVSTFVTEAGDLKHHDYILVPVIEENGLVGAVAGSTRDITAGELIKKALAASEERLQQIFAQAPVAIIVLRGKDLHIELANPTYQMLLQGRELVGRKLADSIPELGNDVWAAFDRVLATGEPFVANDFLLPYDQDGDGINEDHWFNLMFHPLRNSAGEVDGVVAVCSDITVQVKARKELERVNRELEEFAYVASHDLQEPLRMVNIYTELLAREFDGSNEQSQEFVTQVKRGVHRMKELIQDLLTFSRTVQMEQLAPGVADVEESLKQAMSVLKNRIEERGATITAGSLPSVRGETAQMTHVFQNLLSNSLKYCDECIAPQIHISARAHGEDCEITVSDNGIGFEQQYAERIFGLFKRLHKEEYPGTGLGLAICKRIVERYGGRIWAESQPGKGSTFHLLMPKGDTPCES